MLKKKRSQLINQKKQNLIKNNTNYKLINCLMKSLQKINNLKKKNQLKKKLNWKHKNRYPKKMSKKKKNLHKNRNNKNSRCLNRIWILPLLLWVDLCQELSTKFNKPLQTVLVQINNRVIKNLILIIVKIFFKREKF